MRYDSFPNSNKQLSDSLRAERPPVFITLKHCFAYCFAQRGPAGVCMHPSSLWSIILQCLGGDQSTIPHMKGDIHSFNMRYSGMPCPKDLQRYGPGEGPCESPLVRRAASAGHYKNTRIEEKMEVEEGEGEESFGGNTYTRSVRFSPWSGVASINGHCASEW